MSAAAAFALTAGVVLLGAATRRPSFARPVAPPAVARGRLRAAPAWWRDLLVAAAVDGDADRAWVLVRWAAVVAVGSATLLAGPAAGLLLALLVAATPRLLRPMLDRRIAARRDAQLPDALARLAATLRAGVAPGPAVVSLAHGTPRPLGDDLAVIALEVEHGAPLADAVDRWGDRAATPDARLAAAALSLAARSGGGVAQPVDRVAGTLRERRELQAEVRALATQARASALVLTFAPAAFTAVVSTIEPGVPKFLLGSPAGLACLAVGAGLQVAGAAWSARILRSAA